MTESTRVEGVAFAGFGLVAVASQAILAVDGKPPADALPMTAFGATFLLAGVAIYVAATSDYSPERGSSRDWITLGHGVALLVVAAVLFVMDGAAVSTVLTAVVGAGVVAVGAHQLTTS